MEFAGAFPDLFGPFYASAFLVSYLVSAWVGYRRGWPPAAWLLVLAAAGIGGALGTRIFSLGIADLQVLLTDGVLPEAGTRRIPGAVAGALLAAVGARWALGLRQSILDPLAYGGLAALAVVRVGCFLAGCCFGTPTEAPWGLTYAEGSFAHGFHLAHGIVEAGAAAPHPVHPIPLYDIAFALLGLALLPALGRRLRQPGSLCWAAVGGYAACRFVQDVARANEVEAFAGLTAVQLACAMAAVAALAWVVVSERRPVEREPEVAEPGLARLAALFVGLVAVRVALDGWWTPADEAVLLVRLVPATAALAVVAWRRSAAPQVRWATTLAAAGLPLVLGFQLAPSDSSGRFTFWAVDAHATQGLYEDDDICSTSLWEYRTAGAGFAHVTVDPDRRFSREVGVRLYGGSQQSPYDVARYDDQGMPMEPVRIDGHPISVLAPYVQVEGHHLGGHLGLQVGQVPLGGNEADDPGIFPSFGARLGPRPFHVQFGMLDGPHFGAPAAAAHVGIGTGTLTARGQEVRVQGGVSGSGYYVSGTLPLGDIMLEPMVALGPEQLRYSGSSEETSHRIYQASLRARYQFGNETTPPGRVPALPDSLVLPPVAPDTTAR